MFNRIQSSNSSRPIFPVGSLSIGTLLALVFVLGLIAPSFSMANDSFSPLPTDEELSVLEQTFRGFVFIAFPSDRTSQCTITPTTVFERRFQEFHRSWFTISYEARCPGANPMREQIWFLCTQRTTHDCTLADAPPAAMPAQPPAHP